LIGKPILWNFENQLTGDLMHLIGNNKTEKIDSLKVLNNSFIISKDTVGTGYNQVKGLNLYSKFKNNKIYETDVVKNAEVIFYMRNEAQELIGINKSVCSRINMIMDDNNKIETITLFNNPDSDIFPEKDLPENARLLRGFEWRGDERIKSKEDIYPADEVEIHNAIVLRSKEKYEEDKIGREIEDNKLKDKLSGEDVYNEIFKKYNNRLVRDKNNQLFLVKNFRFRFSFDPKIVEHYKKKYPKYNEEVKIALVLWDWKRLQYGKYDGGIFDESEEPSIIEYPKKEFLTNEEIFSLYDGRVIIDNDSQELFVRNGKYVLPKEGRFYFSKKFNNKRVYINQKIWDWKTMQFGIYDGGFYLD
jgi:hypothetical protein